MERDCLENMTQPSGAYPAMLTWTDLRSTICAAMEECPDLDRMLPPLGHFATRHRHTYNRQICHSRRLQ